MGQLREQISKASDKVKIAANKRDAEEWKSELERLQGLLPDEAQLSSLTRTEIPELEKQLADEKEKLPDLTAQYDNVSELIWC